MMEVPDHFVGHHTITHKSGSDPEEGTNTQSNAEIRVVNDQSKGASATELTRRRNIAIGAMCLGRSNAVTATREKYVNLLLYVVVTGESDIKDTLQWSMSKSIL
jgi:hypothetical protein